jgi:hypothetical protein
VGVSRKRRLKTSTISSDDTRSIRSGPWSVDWLRNVQQGDIGLISSNKKRLKKVVRESGAGGTIKHACKRKVGGVLRHPVLMLKKVARLPSKDREEVMKVLKKSTVMDALKHKITNRRRRREKITKSLDVGTHNSKNESSSMASVNNDWQNWVALQGPENAKKNDIKNLGKVIGVSYTGDNNNQFSVLSRPKKVYVGPVLTPVGTVEGVEDGGN